MRWSLACGCWQGAACEEEDGPVAGFASVLGPGLDYASPNYRFFAHRWGERARAFVYIDRIVVAARTQRAGLGRLLYERLFTDAAAQWPDATICCEVNLRPANEASLRFHEGLGFVRVGEQSTESGAKRVALLERRGGRSGLGGAL
jgi:predicted GNAT superfamily acetyltransferase